MTEPKARAVLVAMLIFWLICFSAAFADETVQIANSAAVLMRPDAPAGGVILMPGGDGLISPGPNGEINRLLGSQFVEPWPPLRDSNKINNLAEDSAPAP